MGDLILIDEKKKMLAIDIDGVIAGLTDKQKKFVQEREKGIIGDWDRDYYSEIPYQPVIPNYLQLVETLWRDDFWTCFFNTGRSEKYMDETWDWIHQNLNITIETKSQLKMRGEKDFRPNAEIKFDNLPHLVSPLRFALEDDPKTQKMYMEAGFYLIG